MSGTSFSQMGFASESYEEKSECLFFQHTVSTPKKRPTNATHALIPCRARIQPFNPNSTHIGIGSAARPVVASLVFARYKSNARYTVPVPA